MSANARWKLRFQNLDRAVALLREPLAEGVDRLHEWFGERTDA